MDADRRVWRMTPAESWNAKHPPETPVRVFPLGCERAGGWRIDTVTSGRARMHGDVAYVPVAAWRRLVPLQLVDVRAPSKLARYARIFAAKIGIPKREVIR